MNPPLDLLKPLIALLAIVNPIGAVPFFLAFTHGLSHEQRQRTLRRQRRSLWLHIPVGYLCCIGSPRTDGCTTPSPPPG